ncbi:hypothetical protein FEM48_Zijuj09G0088200 [Ziziphus jujuba var. spinosa]|uniref:R13L1/DRL21-like LRR repeat region domain-containing protein n=1 Tax=Ziziphus jujuba var. spinosa TaxID=714518 RepID=A0A978US11_ZIZJJ|nr:hypothetical protein FEM48_Zijuj09G0088200 [Ziziphus jujuba var. spinosa]
MMEMALPRSSNQIQTLPLFVIDIWYYRLMEKEGIQSLGLYSGDDDVCPNIKKSWPQARHDVATVEVLLGCLQSHQNLKRILVKGYPGFSFPPWRSLTNLTAIELIDCRNCEAFPTLGNFTLLNSLLLQGMHRLRRISE